MKKSLICLLLLGMVGSAYTCDEHGVTGIVEDNGLYLAPDAKGINSMDEDTFNAVIDQVENTYKPIIKEMGGKLQVIRKWSDGTVNAYAQRSGRTWKVSMFGGLARHKAITPDGFAMVVCHEIGHHIGGAPKKVRGWSSWASNEGQSDYWASTKCMKRSFMNDDNVAIVAKMDVPEVVKEACTKAFGSDENENALCIRSAMAGQSLANLFKDLRNLDKAPGFDTPDPATVSRTNDNHPQPQCRMDTYYMGALCDKTLNETVSQSDAEKGLCNRIDNYPAREGTRPLCWYKPKRM